MNMKLSKFTTATLLPVLAITLVLGFQNCAPGELHTAETASYSETSEGMQQVEEKLAIGTNYSENVFTAMLNLTGVSNPSQATINSANDKKAKIAESGKAESVTAPMWMAITNLAGDVCLDLVNQEKALVADQRRIFPQVNFATGPASISSAAKDDVIRRMARSFWGRNETTQEKAVIRSELDAAFTGVANTGAQTENAMLFTCAAMLASLDAQIQ